jgi:hypothetical protein
MKLLSKTAWRKITNAICRVCPKISQRTGGFELEAMEGRTLLSVGLDPHFGTGGVATGRLRRLRPGLCDGRAARRQEC